MCHSAGQAVGDATRREDGEVRTVDLERGIRQAAFDQREASAILGRGTQCPNASIPMKPARFLYLNEWDTPAHKYPRQKLGCAEVRAYKIGKGIYDMYGVNRYKFFESQAPLTDIQLKIRGKVWMVSDPPHWHAMQEHAGFYHGHVLCAGLGLGLIVHALNDNPRVKQITVIEREQDVIDLISPHLPKKKLTILHGDFWNYTRWSMSLGDVDGVFYDLFVGNGRELQAQAMRVWFQLHEAWPKTVRRIHGFNNEQLESLDKLIERM